MKSIYQYTPATWDAYSREVLGHEANMDANTESFVTYSKVKKWLDEGKSPKQILSMWNAGGGEPDAWTGKFSHGGDSVGTNKYGVNYDVPSYVKKGLAHAKQFYVEMAQKQSIPQTPQSQSQPQTQSQPDPLQAVISMIRQAKAPASGGQSPTSTSSPALGQPTSQANTSTRIA
jgi:hypothetical protein